MEVGYLEDFEVSGTGEVEWFGFGWGLKTDECELGEFERRNDESWSRTDLLLTPRR